MSMNRFHKYVSSIRKSQQFKPTIVEMGYKNYIVAEPKSGPTCVIGGYKIKEFVDIAGGYENVMVFEKDGNIHLTHLWM